MVMFVHIGSQRLKDKGLKWCFKCLRTQNSFRYFCICSTHITFAQILCFFIDLFNFVVVNNISDSNLADQSALLLSQWGGNVMVMLHNTNTKMFPFSCFLFSVVKTQLSCNTATSQNSTLTAVGFDMNMSFHHHPPTPPRQELYPSSGEITRQCKRLHWNQG